LQDRQSDTQIPQSDITPSLVERLRSGDSQAGEILLRQYRDTLVRFCWGYLGRLDEAEDAVQETCCRVLSAETVPDAFRPWMYKLARHHCLNLLRQRARRPDGDVLPAASQIYGAMTGNLTRLVRGEQASRLAELVQSLPDDQREVLRLRYVEDLSRTEIADVLDLNESVVKSRLFEGMKRLREAATALRES